MGRNRVFDRVLPGQPGQPARFFLSLFFLQPGPVPVPDRQGPGSTRRVEPGFKIMLLSKKHSHHTIK